MNVVAVAGDPDPIHLSIKEEEATGAQTASCSVLHSCPTSPPVLNWNQPGKNLVQTQTLEGGQFMVTSNLTFHPTRVDHNKTLRCSVKYHGGLHRHAEQVINVKCECLCPVVDFTRNCKCARMSVWSHLACRVLEFYICFNVYLTGAIRTTLPQERENEIDNEIERHLASANLQFLVMRLEYNEIYWKQNDLQNTYNLSAQAKLQIGNRGG